MLTSWAASASIFSKTSGALPCKLEQCCLGKALKKHLHYWSALYGSLEKKMISLVPPHLLLFVCSIQALMSAPNPDDPLDENIAKHWKTNEVEAMETAKQWTLQYAQPS